MDGGGDVNVKNVPGKWLGVVGESVPPNVSDKIGEKKFFVPFSLKETLVWIAKDTWQSHTSVYQKLSE